MKTTLLSILLIPFCCISQNWDLFNKNYRYNYKFDNSSLITNVLFADSVTQGGTDTIYHLNRIAVECPGKCYNSTVTANGNQTLVIGNMPQFLQRTIKKLSTGAVHFIDTATFIFPSQINQSISWTFELATTKLATCFSVGVQSLFGTPDSVKTILLNGIDTIKLSKSYGIIVFPEPYAKNKYYRLAGIENRHSYDQVATFGLKVPNAWDFYDFQVGQTFCHKMDYDLWNNIPSYTRRCSQMTIVSKTVTSSGYEYGANVYGSGGIYYNNPPTSCSGGGSLWPTTIVFKRLFRDTLIANKMYPKMLIEGCVVAGLYAQAYEHHYVKMNQVNNVVELKSSVNGRQYKVFGNVNCLPNSPAPKGKYYGLGASFNNIHGVSGLPTAALFGTGLGFMGSDILFFEMSSKTCLLCSPDYGSLIVDVPSQGSEKTLDIYPNPADNSFIVYSKNIKSLKVYNLMGQKVLSETAPVDNNIDCSNFLPGVYTVVAEIEGSTIVRKISVQH